MIWTVLLDKSTKSEKNSAMKGHQRSNSHSWLQESNLTKIIMQNYGRIYQDNYAEQPYCSCYQRDVSKWEDITPKLFFTKINVTVFLIL